MPWSASTHSLYRLPACMPLAPGRVYPTDLLIRPEYRPFAPPCHRILSSCLVLAPVLSCLLAVICHEKHATFRRVSDVFRRRSRRQAPAPSSFIRLSRILILMSPHRTSSYLSPLPRLICRRTSPPAFGVIESDWSESLPLPIIITPISSSLLLLARCPWLGSHLFMFLLLSLASFDLSSF